MSRGRNEEALQVLARVHANGDQLDEYVLAEYAEIKEKLEWEQKVKKPSYFALLFSKKYARRTYIGMGAQFWQQAVGINSILYYAPFLFEQAGVGSTEASLLSNVIEGRNSSSFLKTVDFFRILTGFRCHSQRRHLAKHVLLRHLGSAKTYDSRRHRYGHLNASYRRDSQDGGKPCIFAYGAQDQFQLLREPARWEGSHCFSLSLRGELCNFMGHRCLG